MFKMVTGRHIRFDALKKPAHNLIKNAFFKYFINFHLPPMPNKNGFALHGNFQDSKL